MTKSKIAQTSLAMILLIQVGCCRSADHELLPSSSGSLMTWKEHAHQVTSDNTFTAIQLFFQDYRNGHAVFFGQGAERKTYGLDHFKIDIIPEVTTHDPKEKVLEGRGNVAGHLNELLLLLTYKWIIEGNPNGPQLLDIVKAENPDRMLSIVDLEGLKLADLKAADIISTKLRIEMLTWEWDSRERMAGKDDPHAVKGRVLESSPNAHDIDAPDFSHADIEVGH